ncbi:GrpB family protein [Nocardioides sp. SYSU D00038]|uniref:GrpB family protein n=1 Tax=Nocardioides sp. SYSU D00038 TaxID=2812554 RepID=UPI001967E902|nr:GrpB family protein [Nocardioides sp. SYSU D00038]
MPTPAEITRHHAVPADRDPFLPGQRSGPLEVDVVEPDPAWPAAYAEEAAALRDLLGPVVLELHHVGSTSVPGLPAKPVLDVDLVVADPADEASYVPVLTAAGWVHRVREPWWHEHRLLQRREPRYVHLHVFGPDCPEVVRHLMFRDWLREHADDRERYAAAKRAAGRATLASGGSMLDYNAHKEPVVLEIYDRMFRHHGLL